MASSPAKLRTALPPLALAAALGCGANTAPILQPIPNQDAAVGLELAVIIRATDADGDSLSYSFDAPELPGLDKRMPPATLGADPDGTVVFRWIPSASDSRPDPYEFDFTISDGKAAIRQAVLVTVHDQGAGGAPVFVKPIGSGTTLLLDSNPCLMLPIEVSDTDSTSVMIAEEDPHITGAQLMASGPFTATWTWCPTAAQVQSQDRFYLHLSADDGGNAKTLKIPPYLIVVVSSGKGNNCPGSPPVIIHTPPGPQATVNDLKIDFGASDDVGLKSTPILYFSTTDPGPTPDLSTMMPAVTLRVGGDAQNGAYEGTIPNPVASAPPGTTATIYYLFTARDNDDPTGGCNHTAILPDSGAFNLTVTNAGSGGLPPCEPCSSDSQCGGVADNCITIGASQRCAVACGSGGSCPSGYVCTSAAVISSSGASAKQCVPQSGSCASTVACADDLLEDNDSMSSIPNATAAALPGDSYPDLMMCPLPSGEGVDEDWFGLPVSEEGEIAVSIASNATTDLDLELYDAAGNLLDYSLSLTSNEKVRSCVQANAGTLYARVFSLDTAPEPAPYALSVQHTPMTCACQPDANEPDDNASEAYPFGRPTTPQTITDLTICPGNSDFFAVTLDAGDQIVVDLTFTQVDANGDLDIHFFSTDGKTDLTPCSPTQTGCMINNGQGYESNEHFTWSVSTAGTYYVVVRGYDSADTNAYAITVQVQ
jgi:hypothetical protein